MRGMTWAFGQQKPFLIGEGSDRGHTCGADIRLAASLPIIKPAERGCVACS